MSDLKTKTPVAMRTYAVDLALAKKTREDKQNTPKVPETPKKGVTKNKTEVVSDKESRSTHKTIHIPDKKPKQEKKVNEKDHTLKGAHSFPKVAHIPDKKAKQEKKVNEKDHTLKGAHSFPKIKKVKLDSKKETIPSFHELQKKVSAINTEMEGNNSSNNTSFSRQNVGYDSTIITDTISDRFHLFPSIVDSVKKWFKKQKNKQKRKSVPTFTVPETQRRKGIIQKATTKSGAIFTADSETIKEKILRRQRQNKENTEEVNDISWSPFTDIGYELLEAPDKIDSNIQNISVTYRKIPPARPVERSNTVETTEPLEVAPEEVAPANDIVPEPEAQPEVTPVENIGEKKHTFPSPPTIHIPQKTFTENSSIGYQQEQNIETDSENDLNTEQENEVYVEKEDSQTEVIKKDRRTISADPVKVPKQNKIKQREHLNVGETFISQNTNKLSLLAFSFVVLILLTVFQGKNIINYAQNIFGDSNENTITFIAPDPLIKNSTVLPINIDSNQAMVLNKIIIEKTISGPAGLVEMAIISPTGNELSPTYVLDLLNYRTTPHFEQSINKLRFVTINHSDPSIIINFTDKSSVRGGLLLWEPLMIRDIAENTDSNENFIDKKIGDIDTRVLEVNDEVILIYGLINDSTAIITHDLDIFNQIVEQGF